MPERPSEDRDHYAVFGNPVRHSLSPWIHARFAELTGQNMIYTAELVELDRFPQAVAEFARHKGKGLNITVPFKQQAWQLATRRSERAERAGAVNTLVLEGDGNYYGENTDGTGLVQDLINNHIVIENSTFLIIGAGGATRGVIEPILEHNPVELVIANRTVDKALQLASDFSTLGNISGCGLEELAGRSFDIVINATSASLNGKLPPLPDSLFNANACAYDMMYAAMPTPFMQWAGQHGVIKIYDGLGMLVEQAAESFRLWRGVKPETSTVIREARTHLK